MSTTKLYTVAGTSTFNGKTKVRFANDYVSRFKILTKNGHENVNILELPNQMNKADVCKFLQSHEKFQDEASQSAICLLYTSPSPRDKRQSRMPSSA